MTVCDSTLKLKWMTDKKSVSFAPFLKKIKNFFPFQSPRHFLAIFLTLAAILLVSLGIHPWQPGNKIDRLTDMEFRVLSARLEDGSGQPRKIIITFNQPVNHESLKYVFSLRPTVEGSLTHGSSDTEAVFEATEPFPEGTYLYLEIAPGLKSKKGKFLVDAYAQSIKVPLVNELISFYQNNVSGRLLSFSSHDPISVVVGKSRRIKKAYFSLYTSDSANLLDFLAYQRSEETNPGGYTYSQEKYLKNFLGKKLSSPLQTHELETDEKTLTFNLKPGVYYLEGQDEYRNPVNATFLVVNSFGTLFRQDDLKLYVPSFDLKTNRPLDGSTRVSLYNLEDTPQLLASYDSTGLLPYQFPFGRRLDLIIVDRPGEVAVIPVKLPQSQADINVNEDLDSKSELFLYTDRPIYKPKDTVRFRGVVRKDGDALYSLPSENEKIRVWLSGFEKSIDLEVSLSPGGIFSGEFVLPDKIKSTQYLYASDNLDKDNSYSSGYAYFDVEEYVKPDFELTSEADKPESIGKSPLTFRVKGSYFSGQPLKNTPITYSIYATEFYELEKAVYSRNFNVTARGGMCGPLGIGDEYYGIVVDSGTLTLDANGQASVVFDPAKIKDDTSQTVTFVAEKTDSSENEIVSATKSVIHASTANIFFPPITSRFAEGDSISLPFYVEALDGQKLPQKNFNYQVVVETGRPEELIAGETATDADGRGTLKFTATSKMVDKYVLVKLEGTDVQGNKIKSSRPVYISSQNAPTNYWERQSKTFLKITSPKNSFVVGDSVELRVFSPTNLTALLTLERGRVYSPRIVTLAAGENTITFPVTPELSPSITPVFSFFTNGRYYSEGLSLNIPAMHKLLSVEIIPNKSKFDPSETAEITIRTKDSSGNPVPARLSLSLVDKAIFALRKNATPAIHSSFYFFRSRSTNASSSLTSVGIVQFGGGKGGGGGFGGPTKLIDTLYWNPTLVTGDDGTAKVTVPLQNITTTWKAQVIASTASTDLGQADVDILVARN